MLVDYIHTVEDIVKLLVQPGSSITIFFNLCTDTQFQWDPYSRAAKYMVGTFCDFFD